MAAFIQRHEPAWKTDLIGKPAISQARVKYKYGERIGRGSFGSVYLSTGLGGKVAIKLMHCKKDEDLQWAASEMQILMTVSGQRNVVTLLETFCTDGMPIETTQRK